MKLAISTFALKSLVNTLKISTCYYLIKKRIDKIIYERFICV